MSRKDASEGCNGRMPQKDVTEGCHGRMTREDVMEGGRLFKARKGGGYSVPDKD